MDPIVDVCLPSGSAGKGQVSRRGELAMESGCCGGFQEKVWRQVKKLYAELQCLLYESEGLDTAVPEGVTTCRACKAVSQ